MHYSLAQCCLGNSEVKIGRRILRLRLCFFCRIKKAQDTQGRCLGQCACCRLGELRFKRLFVFLIFKTRTQFFFECLKNGR